MTRLSKYFLIFTLTVSCSVEEVQQDDCIPFDIPDTFEYPIRPGSEEWSRLGSLAEKVQVCQIPEQTLESISTEGLLETLLNYPLILDYGAFNDMQMGFERIISENNGFKEFYSREDLFSVISDRYELMYLTCDEDIYPPFVIGKAAPTGIAFQTYELFIFQDEFLHNCDHDEISEIFGLIYEKLKIKIELGYSSSNKVVSSAILVKIMYESDFKPFVDICSENEFIGYLVNHLPGLGIMDNSIIPTILEYAEEFYASS